MYSTFFKKTSAYHNIIMLSPNRDSAVCLCIVPIVYACSIILACGMYQDYNQCMLAGLQQTKVILHVHYSSSLLLGIRDP